MIAALYVAKGGCYFDLSDVDPWDEKRDARLYDGPHSVVAHPPCQLWVNLAAVNWKRYRRQLPAWYEGGGDGYCFESALAAVRRWGGVLEHPAGSHAWERFDLLTPELGKWLHFWSADDLAFRNNWVTEVWQSAYGHGARKRTWLLCSGVNEPPALNWSAEPGTHQIGWFDRLKPTLSKRAASATPVAFREALIDLARLVSPKCPETETTRPSLAGSSSEEPPRFELGNGGFAGHYVTEHGR